jgi:hypothetical protein
MEGIGLGLGALGFWSFIAVCVIAGIWDGIRKREARHETLRHMIESEQPIDQGLMESLLGDYKRLDRDLRTWGLILLFVAPGLALLGWFISLQWAEWLLPMLGVAALVGCVSIGLLVAAKVVELSYKEDNTPPLRHPAA